MAIDRKIGKLILPAVKGKMGDRMYFVSVMRMQDVVDRVRLARTMYKYGDEEPISSRLQRDLKDKRLQEISEYLLKKTGHFFNALVVAVYGTPKWRYFDKVSPKVLSDYKDALGFLELSGKEKMYALDGQHRLRGIERAIGNKHAANSNVFSESKESIGVVFVAHDSDNNISRSRRLFVDLNKRVEKVSKRDIIYLDEDDAAAIITRRLVEDLKGQFAIKTRVYNAHGNALPETDEAGGCFTTIGTFYDCLNALFNGILVEKSRLSSVKDNGRISDDILDVFERETKDFFVMMEKHIPEVGEYFAAPAGKLQAICRKYRKKHLLFRPMGLKVFVDIVCDIYKFQRESEEYDKNGMNRAIQSAAALPLSFDENPALGLVWSAAQKIVPKNFPLLKKIYRYMLDIRVSGKSVYHDALQKEYQYALGNDTAQLPQKIGLKK